MKSMKTIKEAQNNVALLYFHFKVAILLLSIVTYAKIIQDR